MQVEAAHYDLWVCALSGGCDGTDGDFPQGDRFPRGAPPSGREAPPDSKGPAG